MQLPVAVLLSHMLEKLCLQCSCNCPGNPHLAWASCWVRGVLQDCPEEQPSTTVTSQGLLHPVVLICGLFFFPLIFQDLIEKVVILRKAVQITQDVDPNAVGALLAEKMSQYASLLAAQGSIAAALTFLPVNTNQVWGFQVFYSLSLCEQVYFKQRSLHGAVSQQDCRLKCTSPCVGLAELAKSTGPCSSPSLFHIVSLAANGCWRGSCSSCSQTQWNMYLDTWLFSCVFSSFH